MRRSSRTVFATDFGADELSSSTLKKYGIQVLGKQLTKSIQKAPIGRPRLDSLACTACVRVSGWHGQNKKLRPLTDADHESSIQAYHLTKQVPDVYLARIRYPLVMFHGVRGAEVDEDIYQE